MTGLQSVWSIRFQSTPFPNRECMSISSPTTPCVPSIAKVAGLRDLPRLTASFDITREGPDAIRIDGEVSAPSDRIAS